MTAFNITDEVLADKKGCRQTVIRDLNADGLPDIFRFASPSNKDVTGQACPSIAGSAATLIYLNNGDGSFTKKTVTGVSPNSSNSSFTLKGTVKINGSDYPYGDVTAAETYYIFDVDGDGFPDIVTTKRDSGSVAWTGKNPSQFNSTAACSRLFKGDGTGAFVEVPNAFPDYFSMYGFPSFNPPGGALSNSANNNREAVTVFPDPKNFFSDMWVNAVVYYSGNDGKIKQDYKNTGGMAGLQRRWKA
jgi:hypothetical protein